MRFSWKGLLVAPLVVPAGFSLLCVGSSPGKHPFYSFFFFLELGSIVSYGTTIVAFLPGLFLVSRFMRLNFWKICLLGTLVGVEVYFPITYFEYQSSGPDSGPPEGTFFAFLGRTLGDSSAWIFPIAGCITAVAYWLMGSMGEAKSSGKLHPQVVSG